MRLLKISGFLLCNLLVLKLFSAADNRSRANNPEGLLSDVTHLPGGGSSNGETTPKGGDPGTLEPFGTKPADRRGDPPPQVPGEDASAGDLGSMATGTPGPGGEIGQKVHEQREKKD